MADTAVEVHHGHGAHEHHGPEGFLKYIWSTDHKMIAMQYLFLGMFMALIGGYFAYVFRMQLAHPGESVTPKGGNGGRAIEFATPTPGHPTTVLDDAGLVVRALRVDHDPVFRARVLDLTGRWTVPQILVDGQPIGGFAELRELDRRGLLAELAEPTAG